MKNSTIHSKMSDPYFDLKCKLEELGYNNTLPVEAVPLVECILADLLQTTRSLQHYMDLSKEALVQRDALVMEAEPYKCDNAKLIQENNLLHKQIITLQDENLRITKDTRRKLKSLSDEIAKKETTIGKLHYEIRELSLRGLCTETLSSRNKCRNKDGSDNVAPKSCNCIYYKNAHTDKGITEINNVIQGLQEKNEVYQDEILLLKSQIEHRDNEIMRLNMLLEGGRTIKTLGNDWTGMNEDGKLKKMMIQLQDMELETEILKKELDSCLAKQHEAMLRALKLADKNKALEEEQKKVDELALKVEQNCNRRLTDMQNEISALQSKINRLTKQNTEMETELSTRNSAYPKIAHIQQSLDMALKEKESLQKEVKDLVDLNKGLQEKIISASQCSKDFHQQCKNYRNKDCPTRIELELLLEKERKAYEKHLTELQDKLSESVDLFNKYLSKGKLDHYQKSQPSMFIKELQSKICESEQKILMLKKENDDLKSERSSHEEGSRQNYKDIIRQLNAENSELSKENILLSQQVSRCKNLHCMEVQTDVNKRVLDDCKQDIEKLMLEIQILKKDKNEYNLRYKQTLESNENLKRQLAMKQKDVEQLETENCSYKMTNRTDKASSEHLKEECHFLREQIKRMQTDYVKEKTLANQIKNIQLETERSNNEIQNELLNSHRRLNRNKENIETLERKCKDLQSEIMSLKADKTNLIENIKKVDEERDKLVIELDNKAETVSILEQKINSQSLDINKLESEISDLKRRLNANKVVEHKVADYEAQISFLNGEILRLTHQNDAAVMENKQLQNSLADANGTLKLNRLELEKSRKEVEGLRQQLQHYVVEIRRIEELLSEKEAERSDMLEHFASLSVEANILENTNHSLESESASKSQQLLSYTSKIQQLEAKLVEKENTIDSQCARIDRMTIKITSLENEIKLINEEKTILEQNNKYLKQMCNNLQSEHSNAVHSVENTDSELKLYENRIKNLSSAKARSDQEKEILKENLNTTERLLSNARKEIVELKLALQDATTETESLQNRLSKGNVSRKEFEVHERTMTHEELRLPLTLEETIHEVSHEEDEDSSRYHEVRKKISKYTHSSTM